MFQLEQLTRRALTSLSQEAAFQAANLRGEALEASVERAFAALRMERERMATTSSPLARLDAALDRKLRTDELEYLDREDVTPEQKLAIVRGVDLMNTLTLSYQRFLRYLQPHIERIARVHGRPARLLEIASGAGGFAMSLARIAERQQLPVVVTGSDVVPIYVSTANREARARGLSVTFHELDALNMHTLSEGAYDLVFIAQSTHHFSPGQLARMVNESSRVATSGFVSIDGLRSLHMLCFVAGSAFLSLQRPMVHDALLSARKFYSEPELALMGRMGAPAAHVEITRLWPLNSVLHVDFTHNS